MQTGESRTLKGDDLREMKRKKTKHNEKIDKLNQKDKIKREITNNKGSKRQTNNKAKEIKQSLINFFELILKTIN